MTEDNNKTATENHAAKKLESLGWGTFIVWVGFCVLVGINFNFSLFGIGIITLIFQYLRRMNNLELEGFWIIAGILFLAGSIWGFLGLEFPLVPIVIIIAGITIISQSIKLKK